MSKKHKKVCKTLNHFEHFLILASEITGCILFWIYGIVNCIPLSAFASLLAIPIGITISAVGLKIFAITARIN